LGGKALLFENVPGFDMPVLMNAFGSYGRMCLALGCQSLEALAGKLSAMLTPPAERGLAQKLRLLGKLMDLASAQPRRVKQGPCQELIQTDQADLTALPVIQCWPEDGAGHPAGEVARRYITLGAVVAKDPTSGAQNAGMYRVQLFGPRQAGMHLHPNHDGAAIWRAWRQRGRDMPAAIVLGGPPAFVYASTAPCPPGIDEAGFAALLSGERIDLVRCRTIDLLVPATAEIVIEGHVSVSQSQLEGPFGDHTGFYSPAEPFPVFDVSAITRRRDAIYPATVVGYPPMEDYYFGKATERIFLPLLRMMCPEVADYDLPLAGAFHNFAFVAIRKGYPDQARKVMHAIWGAGQLAACKFVIVVDADVDVHDLDAVLFAVGAHCDPARDLESAFGPSDILDHAAIRRGSGGKLGIDATRKIVGERDARPYPPALSMPPEIGQLVDRRWREYGLET
jgi:4-hydroxy-3-polyprenylbenzoate decarboxylase